MVKIFASIIEDEAKEQINEMAKVYDDSEIRIMPDVHAGKGCTIGSVIKVTDKVVPNTVGVDIGCGMLVACLGNAHIDLAALDYVINKHIPSGMTVNDKPKATFENNFIARITNWDYIQRSIGSLGGGNHFIEVDVDDEGNSYLVIHSGSRNLGVLVCDYWQDVAIRSMTRTDDGELKAAIEKMKVEGRQKEIPSMIAEMKKPKFKKELAYLVGDDMRNYLHDMELAQIYASRNRFKILETICEHMGLKIVDTFTTVHNYIDQEGIIRKGAVSARKGEKLLIPINMKDGSLICVGKGNPDWLCSAPHGAGRIMSRAQARKTLTMEEFSEKMDGIFSTSVCPQTIDEAPMAYKPIDVILNDIKDTVEIVKEIKPIYNFKAKN